MQFDHGTLTGPGTYHFTDPADQVDCSGTIPVPSDSSAPLASYSTSDNTIDAQAFDGADPNGTSGAFAGCMGTVTGGLPADDSGAAGSLTGAYEAQLPGVFDVRMPVPPGALDNGTFTIPVTQDNVLTPLPSSCSDVFGEDNAAACQMSIHWSGTLHLDTDCGTITFSEGAAPAVGTTISVGQIVSTGVKSRAEITLVDGSIVRVGPQSKVQCNGQGFTPESKSIEDRLKLLLGEMYGATESALGGGHEFDVGTDRAVTGVRGSVFTASTHGSTLTFHVIEGTGFVRIPGAHEFDFPAGEGVTLSGTHYALTQSWPTADRSLVPAAELPPAITHLKLLKAATPTRTALSFRLDRAAKVTVTVAKGRTVFAHLTLNARKGTDTVRPLKRALPRGAYVVRVSATAGGRVSIAQLTVHA